MMTRPFLSALILSVAAMAACAAPLDETDTSGATLDAAPPLLEKSAQAETATAGNTYENTCGPVRARFNASDPTLIWEERLSEDLKKDQAAGLDPLPPEGPDVVSRGKPPAFPVDLAEERLSGACKVVFDLDISGTPQRVDATCSDPRFEAMALETIQTTTFKPATANGVPAPAHSILSSLEFCIND